MTGPHQLYNPACSNEEEHTNDNRLKYRRSHHVSHFYGKRFNQCRFNYDTYVQIDFSRYQIVTTNLVILLVPLAVIFVGFVVGLDGIVGAPERESTKHQRVIVFLSQACIFVCLFVFFVFFFWGGDFLSRHVHRTLRIRGRRHCTRRPKGYVGSS